MSFSIHSTLKLLCVLGLLVFATKAINAQNTEVAISDLVGRTDNTTGSSGKTMAQPVLNFNPQSMELQISGININAVQAIYVLDLQGNRRPLDRVSAAQNLYRLPILKSAYYSIMIETRQGIFYKNIHL